MKQPEMHNMPRLCIRCESHVQHAMVICGSQMMQPRFNSLSRDATLYATRMFNMRRQMRVAYATTKISTICQQVRRYVRLACSTCDGICESHMLQPNCQFSVTRCDTRCDSHVLYAIQHATRMCRTRANFCDFNFSLGIRLDASFSEFC